MDVGPVDRRGMDLDEDLVLFVYRLGYILESQNVGRAVIVVDDSFHESAFLLSFGCLMGPPTFHIRPARNSSAGLPPLEPGRARRPVGMTHPLSDTTVRRKLAPSRCTPQMPSYTALSSAMVKVGPTNAVAMPVWSRSTRARSTASRRIFAWSKASSIFPFNASETGTRAAAAASEPASTVPTSRRTAR